MKRNVFTCSLLIASLLLSGCNTNRPTGSGVSTLIGAGVGAGGIALLGGSKPMMVLGGIGGGMLGYYLSTQRHDAGVLIKAGGQVYQVGDFIGIEIPSDKLFEPNTAELLPQATPILESAADVLQRTPSHNILVSGNTSGIGQARWEKRLSQKRAEKVAAFFWNAGITPDLPSSDRKRRLTYVGNGNYFPIAHDRTNESLRSNSRIQITSYPSDVDLHAGKVETPMSNIGAYKDAPPCGGTENKNGC